MVPVRNRDGEVTHFLGLQQDVTERRTQKERLSVLDRVLRHNIRNRMNVVSGTAELLQGQLPDAAEGEDLGEVTVDGSAVESGLERIIAATEELTRISEQVREFQTVVGDPGEKLERQNLTTMLQSLAETALAIDDEAVFELSVEPDLVVEAHPKLPAALSVGL
ncbi:MAG: hypothetical protein ABEI99_00755, partial [Halobaculum sp.]